MEWSYWMQMQKIKDSGKEMEGSNTSTLFAFDLGSKSNSRECSDMQRVKDGDQREKSEDLRESTRKRVISADPMGERSSQEMKGSNTSTTLFAIDPSSKSNTREQAVPMQDIQDLRNIIEELHEEKARNQWKIDTQRKAKEKYIEVQGEEIVNLQEENNRLQIKMKKMQHKMKMVSSKKQRSQKAETLAARYDEIEGENVSLKHRIHDIEDKVDSLMKVTGGPCSEAKGKQDVEDKLVSLGERYALQRQHHLRQQNKDAMAKQEMLKFKVKCQTLQKVLRQERRSVEDVMKQFTDSEYKKRMVPIIRDLEEYLAQNPKRNDVQQNTLAMLEEQINSLHKAIEKEQDIRESAMKKYSMARHHAEKESELSSLVDNLRKALSKEKTRVERLKTKLLESKKVQHQLRKQNVSMTEQLESQQQESSRSAQHVEELQQKHANDLNHLKVANEKNQHQVDALMDAMRKQYHQQTDHRKQQYTF